MRFANATELPATTHNVAVPPALAFWKCKLTLTLFFGGTMFRKGIVGTSIRRKILDSLDATVPQVCLPRHHRRSSKFRRDRPEITPCSSPTQRASSRVAPAIPGLATFFCIPLSSWRLASPGMKHGCPTLF